MEATIFVDLQRADGSTVAVVELDDYLEMSAADVADTVPALFVRCPHGTRQDLGTLAQLARAIGAGAAIEYRATKVVGGAR